MSGKKLKLVAFLFVIACGIYLRIRTLDTAPLWVDEAESSINALTILVHGVPVDRYQGLPIYENTLVEPWPESAEYEFRDGSYSRGLAVYHAWLPLYAIAASLKAFHVEPQSEADGLRVRFSRAERLKRTWAPRVPAVIFGLIGIIGIYFAGFALGGEAAAWAALLAGAVAAARIQNDQQARYYAATVAISTICTLSVWKVCTTRRWRDVTFCGIALTLLFYTHLLTFADHCVVLGFFATGLLVWRKRPGDLLKFASLAVGVAALTFPWLAATGFLAHRSALPRAWPLLNIREDLTHFLLLRWDHAALVALALASIASIMIFRRRLPRVFSVSIAEFAGPAAYLTAQILVSAGLFLYFIPAASLYWSRLTLSVTAPLFLLQAIVLAVLARAVSRRHAVVIASVSCLLLLAGTGRLRSLNPPDLAADDWRQLDKTMEFLESQTFPEGTRLYALPNVNLVFSYLSGLPIQSIAPVRKSFLDSYPGPVVFVDEGAPSIARGDPLNPSQLQFAARTASERLTSEQAERLSANAATYLLKNELVNDELAERCVRVSPDVASLPLFALDAAKRQSVIDRERDRQLFQMTSEVPILRGYTITKMSEYWPLFSYRFVHPEKRMGANANYADRLRSSTARIIDGTRWVYFQSPAPLPDRNAAQALRRARASAVSP